MRPVELEQLITDLQSEKLHTGVAVHADSKMVIIDDETDERHSFSADESKLLLSSPDSIRRLFEALNYPDEVFVELHDLTIDPEAMAELESFASTVDEM